MDGFDPKALWSERPSPRLKPATAPIHRIEVQNIVSPPRGREFFLTSIERIGPPSAQLYSKSALYYNRGMIEIAPAASIPRLINAIKMA